MKCSQVPAVNRDDVPSYVTSNMRLQNTYRIIIPTKDFLSFTAQRFRLPFLIKCWAPVHILHLRAI
jgi:hypothetical protein